MVSRNGSAHELTDPNVDADANSHGDGDDRHVHADRHADYHGDAD